MTLPEKARLALNIHLSNEIAIEQINSKFKLHKIQQHNFLNFDNILNTFNETTSTTLQKKATQRIKKTITIRIDTNLTLNVLQKDNPALHKKKNTKIFQIPTYKRNNVCYFYNHHN